jgi:hypothetical protein
MTRRLDGLWMDLYSLQKKPRHTESDLEELNILILHGLAWLEQRESLMLVHYLEFYK